MSAGCICEGNWRDIVAKYESHIGKRFTDSNGDEYTFFGLVHTPDDYYYGMYSQTKGMMLYSCVGCLFKGWGFKPETTARATNPDPRDDEEAWAVAWAKLEDDVAFPSTLGALHARRKARR